MVYEENIKEPTNINA